MERGTDELAAHPADAQVETFRLAQLLGYTAGAVALLQAFVVASSALAHQTDIVALQRGLLAYRDSSGGPWLDPQLGRVAPFIIAGYVTAGIVVAVVAALAWYTGRIAASLGGDLELAVAAGRRVVWISWLFWVVATVFSVVVLHADGTLSWAVATSVKLAATPIAQPVGGLFVTAPDLAFVVLQVVTVLLHFGLGLAVGLYVGEIAAERGAERGAALTSPARDA